MSRILGAAGRTLRRVRSSEFLGGGEWRRGGAAGTWPAGGPDQWLVGSAGLLVVIGLVMVYSITAATAGRSTAFLENHGIKVVLGIAAFAAAYRMDYHLWVRRAPLFYLLGLAGLLLVFVPGLSHEVSGARRWIRIGSQTIQPVDFARLGLIVYLAFLLSKPRAKLERFGSGLMPCLIALGLIVLPLLLQPNLSSAVAMTVIAGLLLVAGRIPWRHLIVVTAPVLVALPVLGRGYQSSRVENWIAYWLHGDALLEGNYQLNQSIIAIGSGGLVGQGIGGSRQKWSFLPDAHTDFIFAILGEELGFLGALVVLALVGVLLWRAFEAARRAPDRSGSLLASGIGISVAVYATINVSVATGLFPTTGLPLPLVSYGGTAVLVTLFSLGILANIASQGARASGDAGERSP
jgi:cell division protein FtsW